MRRAGGHLKLERREEHHLLLGAVHLLVEDLPARLLVDLVDAARVELGVEVVEVEVLVAETQSVEFPDSLLHDG